MLRDEIMTRDEPFAAAGLYVLMAFVFALPLRAHRALVAGRLRDQCRQQSPEHDALAGLLYFSFTCLTSVGFGEITPANEHARSLVMIQQTIGVLYFALVVSRLVTLQTRRAEGERDRELLWAGVVPGVKPGHD
jgi:hypothetical protein